MKSLRRGLLWLSITFLLFSLLPVLAFRWIPPPTSAVMLQRNLSEGETQHYRWVSADRISPYLMLAVIASEDQKFPTHHGFDLKEIHKALASSRNGKALRGASTLTQQVARNLLLWQGRSFVRKGLEAWFTMLLELLWPKARILEVYLNIAEMGVRTFGIGAASDRLIGVPTTQITLEQAALIVTALPNPIRMNIASPSDYMLERQSWVLDQMEQLGGLSYVDPILQ